MNLLSIQESHIEVTSLNPVPALLEVKVMQTPEQVPSCITFPVDRATSLEKVFLGELCIFNAFVSIGTHLKFHWHFTDNNITHILGGECSRMENCLSNTVNHTFEKEGVYIVAVNVSNVYGWVEKIISVAVVPQIISNLTFNIMGEHLVRLGENVTFEMELFTTVRQLLFLNATFETGITHTYWLSDDSPAFETNNYLQLLESYGLQHCIFRVRITHQYSKPGCSDVSATVFSPTMMVSVTLPEKLEVYDTIWNIIPSVLWDTVIPSGINTTFLISSSTDKTGSFVSWRITKDNYTLVNTTTSAWSFTYSFQDSGIYNLMAIAFNPLSEVSVVSELIVQEAISGLSLFSENPTCITTGSAVAIWASIQKGVNVTYTWDFDTNTSFFTGNLQAASYHYTEPGIYFVTVKAENEVSSISSEALQILVQDQASGLLIHIPSIITVEESSLLTITVMTGTNLTLDILTNGTLAFTQNGYVAGIPINVEFVFNQTGSLQVVVKARNCVSTLTKTLAVLVVREISTITIEATQLPVFGEGIILIAKVNGIIWANRNYIYTWTLPQNITILSGSPAFLYNCSHTDSQLITVSVTNCASNASSELELNISLANVGPRLFHEANVGAGTTVVFTLKAFYANEESFDIYFGDGNMNTLLCPTERNLRNTSFSYLSFLTLNPGNYVVTVNISNPFYKAPFTRVLPNPVKVCGPIQSIQAEFPLGVNYAELIKQHDGTYATPWLSFTVYSHLEDVSFLYNFDDGTLVSNVNRSRKDVGGISASCYHSFKLAGVFRIRITVYNEFFNATKELGPYYVEILPKGLSIYVNCSVVHKNDIVLFNATVKEGTNVSYTWKMDDQTTYVNKGPVILHRFLTSSVYNVSAIAQNRVGTAISSTSISVLYRMQPVYVYSNQTIYATDTDIIFQAVTNERGSLNFVWYFGDKPPQQTSSPTIKTQYSTANRYNVFVTASNNLSSFTSDIYPITIEKKISLNRLLFNASVLVNCSVVMDCRINAASNASFLWNFGDGTVRTGKTIENHTYKREGEFTVEVTVFNHISSASLSKQIFVLSAPCQPPPVKNMGPSKVQVRRYQNLVLGVTFEADIQCSTFRGITYKWNLYDSSGVSVTFLQIDTNKQTIEIPKHFLSYGNYTAVAKVQVIGSVVYSNYTVPIEVLPTSPVSVIRGGTNVFFSKNNDSLITLDGRDSYDPDYPENRISFIWTCMPVSRISSGCFDKSIILNLAVVTFTASSLKSDFDQFQFTLRVNSGSRSSTSDVFVNFQKNIQIELGISCAKCKGNTINWNERFSVTAECGICKNILNHTLVWSMYLVNASSTPNVEVPFCKVLDTNSPSSLYQSIFVSAPKESPSQASSFYSSSSVSTSNIVPATSSLASADETLERSTTAFPVNQRVLSGITFSDLFASQAMFPLLEDKTTSKQATTSKDLYDLPILIMEGPASGGRSRRKRSNAVSPTSTAIRGCVTAVDASTKDTSTALVAKENGNPKDSLLSISISGTILEELSPEMGEFPIVSEGNNMRLGASITTISVISSSNRIRLNEEKVSNLVNQTLSVNITDPYDFYKGIEEGGGNYDRPTGGSFNNANSEPIYDSSKGGGSNLIDNSNNLSVGPLTSTLLDLDRRQIDDKSSLSITFQPFTLQPGMLYLIELSADLDQQQLGKTQLFFFTNEAPQGMTCLLQPKKGFEIYTDFSIFCTSGKEDLSYKYSYQVGNNSKTILYQGRDIQYYFNLPAGDPSDNYKVTIYIEIGNRFGSTTSPCPAVVTVLPSFLRNETSSYNPDAELYYLVMRNLSSHLLIQNDLETRNYIILLTNVLNRLSQDQRGDRDLHIQVQKALISAVCGLNVNSQIISIAKTVVLYIKSLTQHFLPSDSTKTFELDEQTLRILISMISKSLMVRNNGTEESMQMLTDGIRTTTELLLIYTLSNNRTNVKLITDFMELETFQSEDFQNIVRRAGSITFYLPVSLSSLAVLNENCIISQVIFIKGNPYSWGQSSVKINENVADLTLYNCKTRRKIDVNGLTSPVIIEFQKNEINFEKPTPRLYNFQQVFQWKGNTVQLFLSPDSLNAKGSYYLALLSANYDRKPTNKYTASAVSYSLSIQWISCLYWDNVKEWKTDGCLPMQSLSSSKLNCSQPDNLVPCIVIFFTLIIYIPLAFLCKRFDIQNEKKRAPVYLQDNNPSDKQLYAICIDTGFRSRTYTTAKLWHNNGGHSPSWYLSHVIVKDLTDGTCWFFMAETWLAVDEGDGKVERDLTPLRKCPGFKKVLYCKLTEFLEDFHIWASVYSRPSHSHFSHSQRLAVCLFLFLGYMTLNSVILFLKDEEVKFSKESPVEQLSSTEASAIYNVEAKHLGRKEVFTLLMTVPVALKTVAYQKIKFQPLSLVMTSVQSILLIFITAVAVTLKCKDISSIYVGFHKTNPNFESRKWQPSKDSCQSKKCLPTFDHKQLASSLDYDKLIAARQRSRYLRLVRPPSHLQLKEARERIRKEALIQQTLRNAKIPFTELNNTKDWWNWSLTSLINGLCYDSFCKNAVTNIEAVPARGLFKLIGEPVLWKIHAFDKTDCNILRVYKDFSFSRVPPDNSTIYNTRKQTFVGIFNLCGQIECYNERKTALTLGRTRTEMIDILTQLKSVGWLDKNTKAVVVQFTLYNPPSNLFTTVSFLMEISAGTVFSSTLIESANVYQIISIFDYLIMAFEIIGTFTSFSHDAKKSSRSKHFITFKEVVIYARERFFNYVSGRGQKLFDNFSIMNNNYYLDEFETLMDELLFRLNSLSNSLYHFLPAKQRFYLEEDSTITYQSDCYFTQDSENSLLNGDCFETPFHNIQQDMLRDHLQLYDLFMQSASCLNHSLMDERVRLEMEEAAFHHLQMNKLSRAVLGYSSLNNLGQAQSQNALDSSSSTTKHQSLIEAASQSLANLNSCEVAHQTQNLNSNLAVNHELYNLTKLGSAFPHILCGRKCSEKAFLMPTMQQPISAGLTTKGRKLLRRSQATVINPLEIQRDLTKGIAENNSKFTRNSEKKKGLINKTIVNNTDFSSVGSKRKHQGGEETVISKTEYKEQKIENETCRISALNDKRDTCMQKDHLDLPGSIRPCW
ncbi:PK1L1 protein, partial [Polypterus senegalus]|nr:PK1L1 protein [Polypterus senegalus]